MRQGTFLQQTSAPICESYFCSKLFECRLCLKQEALRPHDASCMSRVASIVGLQYSTSSERNLLLFVTSASDLPLRTIKLCSVLFSSASYSLMRGGLCHKQTYVHRHCYDRVYLTCSKKLSGSQLSLPHGINKKTRN